PQGGMVGSDGHGGRRAARKLHFEGGGQALPEIARRLPAPGPRRGKERGEGGFVGIGLGQKNRPPASRSPVNHGRVLKERPVQVQSLRLRKRRHEPSLDLAPLRRAREEKKTGTFGHEGDYRPRN